MTKEIALHRDEGQSIWMLGILMTLKATAEDTDGALGLVEGLCEGPRRVRKAQAGNRQDLPAARNPGRPRLYRRRTRCREGCRHRQSLTTGEWSSPSASTRTSPSRP